MKIVQISSTRGTPPPPTPEYGRAPHSMQLQLLRHGPRDMWRSLYLLSALRNRYGSDVTVGALGQYLPALLPVRAVRAVFALSCAALNTHLGHAAFVARYREYQVYLESLTPTALRDECAAESVDTMPPDTSFAQALDIVACTLGSQPAWMRLLLDDAPPRDAPFFALRTERCAFAVLSEYKAGVTVDYAQQILGLQARILQREFPNSHRVTHLSPSSELDACSLHVLLTPHMLADPCARLHAGRLVVYNWECLHEGSTLYRDCAMYRWLLLTRPVLDFSAANLPFLERQRASYGHPLAGQVRILMPLANDALLSVKAAPLCTNDVAPSEITHLPKGCVVAAGSLTMRRIRWYRSIVVVDRFYNFFFVPNDELAAALPDDCIVVNVHHGDGVRNLETVRLMQLMYNGVCVISEAAPDDAATQLFVQYCQLDVFASQTEMHELISRYMQDSKLRSMRRETAQVGVMTISRLSVATLQ